MGMVRIDDALAERENRLAAAQWLSVRWLILLALLHGLLYLAIVPPWQHYDEPSHFAYVRQFVSEPVSLAPESQDLRTRREIADSMYRFSFWPPDYQPDLFVPQSPNIGVEQTTVHPPLYYALVAVPVRAVQYLSIETQLYSARCVAVIFYVLTVVIAWRISNIVMPQQTHMHLAVPLVAMLVPAFAALMSAVNNDTLINFSTTALWLACVWLIRTGIRPTALLLASLSLLVGVLTKRTALIGVLPFALALFWAVYRRPVPWWTWVSGGVMLISLAGYAAFEVFPSVPPEDPASILRVRPWLVTLDQAYLRLQIESTIRSLLDWQGSRQIYLQLLPLIFFTFWVRLGWGHVSMGVTGDVLIVIIVVAGTTGLFFQWIRLRSLFPLWQQRCIMLFGITVAVALLATIVRVHPLIPSDGPLYLPRGRYMHLVLLPVVWLLVLGIQGIFPRRWQSMALIGLVICFIVLDIWAWAMTLTAYYYR